MVCRDIALVLGAGRMRGAVAWALVRAEGTGASGQSRVHAVSRVLFDARDAAWVDATWWDTRSVIVSCRSTCREDEVRTTLALDDDLLSEAQRLTGTREKGALVRQALQALIERESARRLAALGGSEPEVRAIRRRQATPR